MTDSLPDQKRLVNVTVLLYSQSVLKRNNANTYLVKDNHRKYISAVSHHCIPIKQFLENEIVLVTLQSGST
jgi:hypothetical protein